MLSRAGLELGHDVELEPLRLGEVDALAQVAAVFGCWTSASRKAGKPV